MPAIEEDDGPAIGPAVAVGENNGTVGATVVTLDMGGTELPTDEPAIEDFSLASRWVETLVCSLLCAGVPSD
jgi:hypothetical protein